MIYLGVDKDHMGGVGILTSEDVSQSVISSTFGLISDVEYIWLDQ